MTFYYFSAPTLSFLDAVAAFGFMKQSVLNEAAETFSMVVSIMVYTSGCTVYHKTYLDEVKVPS